MARRTFHDDAVSRLAAWSYRLALFALAVAALAILVVRSGALEIVPALTTFAAALVFAALAVLLACGAFVVIWRQGLAGFGRALGGLLLGLLLLAYPAYLGYSAMELPALADISTDPANPPRFEALAAARPPASGTIAAAADLQREAYPEISPLQLSVQPRVAYEVSLAVINKHRWPIANARPPAGRRDAVIEATARTLIMGFRDDIIVRVTPLGQGSRVDLRSASRFGRHDLGANAVRVRTLMEEIEAAADAAPEPRPEPEKVEKKPAPKRPAAKKQPEKQPERRR
ncbi:MAG: DUF1499 domain-containing protein [Pseudolabrys sp.]|nr:DUF1499 domain-containing protein [Pseudolabrys sp.]